MARFCKYLFLLTSSIFLLSSCQEGGEAGDLFGQWRLKGSDAQYICFSGSVALFRSIDECEVFANFQHNGDSLFIQCVSINASATDTAIIENRFGFKTFNDIRLKVNTLNDNDLVLSKDDQTWSFYKY
jgi:hypothetical protein